MAALAPIAVPSPPLQPEMEPAEQPKPKKNMFRLRN